MRLRWGGGLLTAGAVLAACASPSPGARALPVGTTLQATLMPSETHRYRVSLNAGEGLEVTASQLSLDVTLSLVDPQGKPAMEEHRRTSGEEVLLAVARESGAYELRVRSGGEKLPPGRYALTAREVPPSSPRRAPLDLHLAARGLPGDADARERLTAARLAWEGAGDRRMAAHALVEHGDRSRKLRDPEAAVAAFAEAAVRFQALGLAADEAMARNLQGDALTEQGNYRAAVAAWKLGLEHADALTLGDRVGLQFSYGSGLKDLGDYAAGLSACREAIPVFERLGMREEELLGRLGLSDIYVMKRDYPAALAELTHGVAKARDYGRPDHEARFLQRLGIVYGQAGDDEAAAEHWRRSLALHHAAGNKIGEAAVLLQLGELAGSVGDDAGAERRYREALDTFRAIGQRQGEARALRRLGELLTARGAYAQATELLTRSLELLRPLGSPQGEVLSMLGLAKAKAGAGEHVAAASLLGRALVLSREKGAHIQEAQIVGEIALLERRRGRKKDALRRLNETIALLEAEQRAALVPSLQATLSGDARPWYAERTDLLMELKQPGQALACSERARARTLLGLLAESHVDLQQGVDPGLLARYRALEVRLSEADRARSAEVAQLTTERDALETEIRRASPAYAALTQPAPLSVEEIRTRVLDPETLLLEFSLGKERSWLFALGKEALVTAPLPPAAEIERAAAELHRSLSARQSPEGEAAALSDLLLRPVAARLSGPWRDRRLAIVPDGALQYVPFGALPVGTPPRPLLEHHEVVVLPSVSVLDTLRRTFGGRVPAPLKLVLLGDPVFDASDPRVRRAKDAPQAAPAIPGGTRGFPRLAFSRDEVKAIAALLPPADVLQATDFKASRALAMDGTLGQYRIIHIATHGLLDTVRPELSGVVLSLVDEAGHPQDGFLRLQDIYNLRLSADLVVLSACQTALGRPIAGEGLVGLTRGFMHAGAPRVVASLWKVDDSATAELMTRFYRNMIEGGQTASLFCHAPGEAPRCFA